ncbi:MAG: 30S ribosomal protein S3, partial [Clostridiales bacterium]
MGQKVNPKGFRIGVIRDWDARWYANNKDFKHFLYEDYQLRRYVKGKLYSSGVSKVDIERAGGQVRINIFTAKPGIVIGRGGQEVEILRKELEKMSGKTVKVNITEVKRPELDAQLV